MLLSVIYCRYAGGIQPPQRRSSQELVVTTGAGVVGTSAG